MLKKIYIEYIVKEDSTFSVNNCYQTEYEWSVEGLNIDYVIEYIVYCHYNSQVYTKEFRDIYDDKRKKGDIIYDHVLSGYDNKDFWIKNHLYNAIMTELGITIDDLKPYVDSLELQSLNRRIGSLNQVITLDENKILKLKKSIADLEEEVNKNKEKMQKLMKVQLHLKNKDNANMTKILK